MIRMSRRWISTPWARAHSSRSSWAKVSPLSRVSLPRKRAMSSRTPRPTTPRWGIGSRPAPPAGDAAVGDGLDAGLVQAADGGAGVVAVPDLAPVPDVAQPVVLRGALEEGVDLVVGVVQAAGVLRRVGGVPGRLVGGLGRLGRRGPGPHRVALRVADQPLQGEDLAGADQPGGGEDLLRAEVVQRADLVVRTPLAPVRRRVGEQVVEGGNGGWRVGHGYLLGWEAGRRMADGTMSWTIPSGWVRPHPRATFGPTPPRRNAAQAQRRPVATPPSRNAAQSQRRPVATPPSRNA